ncbi:MULTISPECIES: hypothetical protein [Enterobacteriaceae]|uniref:Flagellar protein FliT n=1 Tax=Kluyvera genomosp. 2 TaxID=2774054 RepID=A0A2T2Y5A3_9ENTR|nr:MULTISPECIES: hypothetical protein [Enterobacteriaceae]HAT3916973.1 hypothetical protein [Kluyvera ascorbata]PSR47699.1 hypothetical protein C8256_05065 [Kluyvera genomosp. 2]HAT3941886.1 hypothetical protein [Kluyvera ascorbata]HAT3947534.1 hypothetical protein [Kluyvera ascorbata]HAT3953158.1 hypothetical protein [Kluyvera ascorbata]
MSMQHAIQTLTQALRQATEDHNWPSVANVDGQIAELLTAMQGNTLTQAERQALDNLKKVHQQARDYCQGQSDMLAAKMNLAARNREGATAYAQFMDAEGMR